MSEKAISYEKLPEVDSREAAAFCGRVKSYNYTVTVDEFHEVDGHGPGHFYGVAVTSPQAEMYRAGLASCKESGIDPTSEAGLRLRLETAGRKPNPAYRELLKRARDRQREIAAKQEIVDDYNSVREGFVDVGTDKESSAYWGRSEKKKLTCLWSGYLPQATTELQMCGRKVSLYLLPDGDILRDYGVGWSRLTKDRRKIADRELRSRIKGHVYHEPLRSRLAAAERSGALRFPCGSYLGGTYGLEKFEATGVLRNYCGGKCGTTDEKIAGLKEFLVERIEKNREKGKILVTDELEGLLALVTPGCITEWSGE